MFVPPYLALLRALGADAQVQSGEVAIPVGLLRLLLQIALANSDFDEEDYLRENQDVADAVQRGEVESGLLHYIGFGYFEGRRGGIPQVDEKWYLTHYPDIASAIASGTIDSASDHFFTTGAGEGRSPNNEQEESAIQWKKALRIDYTI